MAHLLDYTAQGRCWETAMLAHFLGLATIFTLIILANRDDRRRASMPMADMATFGLTGFEPLWRIVDAIVRRLNPAETPAFDRRKPVHRVAAILMILQAVLILLDTGVGTVNLTGATCCQRTRPAQSCKSARLPRSICNAGFAGRWLVNPSRFVRHSWTPRFKAAHA